MASKLKTAILTLCAAAAVSASIAPSVARPITPAERRQQPYWGNLPACYDQKMLQEIARHFLQREREYWSSGLEIVAYDKIHETGYRANGLDYIPRRYCRASALMNDGKARHVVYSIGENQSMIGWGPGVEWCIVGLDRNYAWGRACMAAQP